MAFLEFTDSVLQLFELRSVLLKGFLLPVVFDSLRLDAREVHEGEEMVLT